MTDERLLKGIDYQKAMGEIQNPRRDLLNLAGMVSQSGWTRIERMEIEDEAERLLRYHEGQS